MQQIQLIKEEDNKHIFFLILYYSPIYKLQLHLLKNQLFILVMFGYVSTFLLSTEVQF